MFHEEFLKMIIPSDTPEEAGKRVSKACREIDEIIIKNKINAVDYMLYTCAMFDTIFGDLSVKAMESCLDMMRSVNAQEGGEE